MQTKLPPLLQAVSGALGSATGNSIVFPLDAATTRMQHGARVSPAKRLSLILTPHRLLSRRNGLSRIYSGLKADTLSTLLSSFIYFYVYTHLQRLAAGYRARGAPYKSKGSPAGIGGLAGKASATTGSKPSPLQELMIGVVAGIVSKGVCLPISTVSVRQQVDEDGRDRRSLIDTLVAIHEEDGITGLFSGLGPTIPLTLLPSLTLSVHSLLLRLLVPERLRAHPPGGITFILGALSNALATIPLYPLVLVKVLHQSGRAKGKEKEGEGGGWGTMCRLVKKEGVQGLYVGLEGQLIKGVFQQGVMMVIKQRVEEGVVRFYRGRS